MEGLEAHRRPSFVNNAILSYLISLQSVAGIYLYGWFGGINGEYPTALSIVEDGCGTVEAPHVAQGEGMVVAAGDSQLGIVVIDALTDSVWVAEIEGCMTDIHKLSSDILILVVSSNSLAVDPQHLLLNAALRIAGDIEE